MHTHLTRRQKWMFAGSAPFVAGAMFTLAAVATPAGAATIELTPKDPPPDLITYEAGCPGERTNGWQIRAGAGPVTDISVYVEREGAVPRICALATTDRYVSDLVVAIGDSPAEGVAGTAVSAQASQSACGPLTVSAEGRELLVKHDVCDALDGALPLGSDHPAAPDQYPGL